MKLDVTELEEIEMRLRCAASLINAASAQFSGRTDYLPPEQNQYAFLAIEEYVSQLADRLGRLIGTVTPEKESAIG